MAAGFDGIDDKLECAGESAFDWERTSPISLAGWIKTAGAINEAFLVKGNAAAQRGIAFNTKSTSGPRVHLHLTNVSTNEIEMFSPAVSFQAFLWVHWIATYDGSSTAAGVKLYRNGKIVTGTPGFDTLTATILNDETFHVAGAETGGVEYWSGQVGPVVADNAEWTAAEALALADIANLYTPPSEILTLAPEIWLPISARPGSSVFNRNDLSGNAHHATIFSAPTVVADPEVVIDWTSTGTGVTDSGLFTTSTSFSFIPERPVLQGVVVVIAQTAAATDRISAVTYGGGAMQRLPVDGFAQDTAGEPGAVYAYFLGAGVPQGTQTVAITVSAGTEEKRAWVFGLLGSRDLQVVASGRVQGDTANPSVTLKTVASFAGLCFSVFYSGLPTPSNVTAGSGYTKMQARDFGVNTAHVEAANKEGANVVCNWTSNNDDVAMIAFAVGLAPPSFEYPARSRRPMPMMRGPDSDRISRMQLGRSL